jgi:hypothetical protein
VAPDGTQKAQYSCTGGQPRQERPGPFASRTPVSAHLTPGRQEPPRQRQRGKEPSTFPGTSGSATSFWQQDSDWSIDRATSHGFSQLRAPLNFSLQSAHLPPYHASPPGSAVMSSPRLALMARGLPLTLRGRTLVPRAMGLHVVLTPRIDCANNPCQMLQLSLPTPIIFAQRRPLSRLTSAGLPS